jgi:hypothetical protein
VSMKRAILIARGNIGSIRNSVYGV